MEKRIKFKDYMKNLNESDPEYYQEVQDEYQKKVTAIEKRGGLRSGAGRKKVYKEERKKVTRMLSVKAIKLLEQEHNKTGKSQNEILNDLIIRNLAS